MKFNISASAVILSAAAASALPAAETQLTAEQAAAIAEEGYIYGYPLVTMELTRRVMTNTASPQGTHAPMGQFVRMRAYPDATFTDVTAPNADTLYSTAWLDLRDEPYVLSLPDMGDRYFLMPMLSGWTDVFQVPGTRTTGNKAQTYAITGPGFTGKLPQGVKELKAPTNLVWILGRTYCTGTPEDYKACHAIMDKYALVPLSSYGQQYTPPAGQVDAKLDMKTAVREQVSKLDSTAYFQLLASLMKDNPPAKEDAPIVAKLAQLGVVPGQPFDAARLDPAIAQAIAAAPSAAAKRIAAQFKSGTENLNGWQFTTQAGVYGTNYAQRALITAIGLGANRPQDAVYPTSTADATGKPYSGANNYAIHFPPGQTPPTNAFWSITMYNEKYYFVANDLNKYTVSPRNALKYNADGSLDIYVQHESPGAEKEANWLPAPKDGFVLMMRLYWPKETAPSILDGSWKPAAVVKVGE